LAKTLKVRRVKTKEDRQRPSVFMRLKTDEQFRGHALFEPDPELDDNPGFFEYLDHWDQQGSAYVPCAGEDCPFCMANDNPSTRALTVWYLPENKAGDRIKVFTMNFGTIQDITDISEEEEGVLGKKFRIKRMSDRGEYRIRPLTDKPLTKKDIKSFLGDVPDLEEMVNRQLKTQHERLKAVEALEDDDDDDENTTTTDDDADDQDDDDTTDDDDDDDDDTSDDSADDDDDDDDDSDDDDSSDDDDDDDDDDDASDDEEETIEGQTFTVAKTDEENEIVTVKMGNKNTDIWLSEKLTVDFDEIKKGVEVTVDAVKDDEGDWVATKLDVAKKAKSTKGSKSKSKGSKKK
jgi:hypothetical protein